MASDGQLHHDHGPFGFRMTMFLLTNKDPSRMCLHYPLANSHPQTSPLCFGSVEWLEDMGFLFVIQSRSVIGKRNLYIVIASVLNDAASRKDDASRRENGNRVLINVADYLANTRCIEPAPQKLSTSCPQLEQIAASRELLGIN
jgi:hypothetical protein